MDKLEHIDVAVIGAGPAGMAAASRAARAGLSVVVLDEQAASGGQIYRGIERSDARRRDILGPDYAAGAPLAAAFAASGARLLSGASVWQVTRERTVHYLKDGAVGTLAARQVVLATGAMERPFPIPGWTLPGVLGAGAAQILLKAAGEVPAEPPVLAGCGPLLYLLGWQYVRAGVPIRALVDTTRADDRWRAKRHMWAALRAWPQLSKGLQLMRALREAQVPIVEAADDLRVEGEHRVEALSFTSKGQPYRIATRLVLLHQGVVPNIQITQSLRAQHRWDDAQLCFTPCTDAWGELDLPDIFVAGDGRGIGGAQAAAAQGELVGLALAERHGRIETRQRDRLAAPLRTRLNELLRIRPFLDALYRPRDENRMPDDASIVCRCEEVTAGDIRHFVSLGCHGPNQAKSFGRCGMGPCQGRQCGLSVTEIIARERGVAPQEVGYFRIRAPIKPLTLGELAGD